MPQNRGNVGSRASWRARVTIRDPLSPPADSSTLLSKSSRIVDPRQRYSCLLAPNFDYPRLSSFVEDRPGKARHFHVFSLSRFGEGDDASTFSLLWPAIANDFRATLLQFAIELHFASGVTMAGCRNTITSLPLQISFSSTFRREASYSGIFHLKSELREREKGYLFPLEWFDIDSILD